MNLGGTLPAKSNEEDGGRTGNPEKGAQPKCKSREETREVQKEEKEKDKKFQQVQLKQIKVLIICPLGCFTCDTLQKQKIPNPARNC